MADSALGRAAVNDWAFVRQLRAGRRVWPETEAKVRAFMATYGLKDRGAAHCSLCNEARSDGDIAACTEVDCPSREREAA